MKTAKIGTVVVLACGIGVATAVASQHDWAPTRGGDTAAAFCRQAAGGGGAGNGSLLSGHG
jgi:hypothetical protein